MNGTQQRPSLSGTGAGARSTIGRAITGQIRNALWQVLCGQLRTGLADSQQSSEARTCLVDNAAAANALLVERFLGDRFDAQLVSCTHLPRVLELTSQGDPAGSLDAAQRLQGKLDQCLLVYDMVEDKTRLFEVLPPEQATTVTRLFRLRRGLAALAARLAAEGAQPREMQ